MNIDWTEVIVNGITVLFSGTFLFGLYKLIKYRKQNKTIKDNQANDSTTQSINMQLALMKTYWTDMMDMMEDVKQSAKQGNLNQDKIIEKIELVDTRLDAVEVTLNNLVEWADGPFNQFLANKQESLKEKQYSKKQK